MTDTDAHRVTWIRVGALGDLLVSLQALETSLNRFPNADFWIMGSSLWIEILDPEHWPRIDGIFVSENGKTGQFYEPLGRQWVLKNPFVSALEFYRQTDVTVNLRIESYRFAWGPFKSLVPTRIGSCPRHMKWLYTHYFPWLGKEPSLHERDWYDGVAKANQGMKKEDIPLGHLSRTGLPKLRNVDPERSELLWGLKHKKFIIVNPTASRVEKAWPKEQFRKLVGELSLDHQVIVVGAPHETEWLRYVANEKARIIQPVQLRDLFDLVGAAEFAVCNTSSLQFVAAAQGTKCFVLMGLASPLRWGPLGPEDQVIEAPIKPNDSKIDLFKREQMAYESIAYGDVVTALKRTN